MGLIVYFRLREPTVGSSGQPPAPHEERCRGQVNGRLRGAVGLHIVFIDCGVRGIESSVVSVKNFERIAAVGWTLDHSADQAGGGRECRAFGSSAP